MLSLSQQSPFQRSSSTQPLTTTTVTNSALFRTLTCQVAPVTLLLFQKLQVITSVISIKMASAWITHVRSRLATATHSALHAVPSFPIPRPLSEFALTDLIPSAEQSHNQEEISQPASTTDSITSAPEHSNRTATPPDTHPGFAPAQPFFSHLAPDSCGPQHDVRDFASISLSPQPRPTGTTSECTGHPDNLPEPIEDRLDQQHTSSDFQPESSNSQPTPGLNDERSSRWQFSKTWQNSMILVGSIMASIMLYYAVDSHNYNVLNSELAIWSAEAGYCEKHKVRTVQGSVRNTLLTLSTHRI